MKIIGVRFREVGKICYYDPDDIDIDVNDRVIAETDRGVECGRVILGPRELSENYTNPIKKIIKKADIEDVVRFEENLKKEKEAFDICKAKIIELDLPMKLISAEYTFDNAKVLFYFTAECRVDFRELVKILASIFRVRIELRQSLSLNPAKISGVCGRLMCCLKNEAETYEYLNGKMPREGVSVRTPLGEAGVIVSTSVLRQTVKVLVTKSEDAKEIEEYSLSEIRIQA